MAYAASTGADTPVWELGPQGAVEVSLPALGSFYGFDPDARQVLYATDASRWGGGGPHGAGPDDLAVADLAIYDMASGTTEVLIADDVVGARWAPNHQDIAYVLATPETYELRWRTAQGEDSLLARGVSPRWSIAPSGSAVAFTRDSGYTGTEDPGLYVVTVTNGSEIKVSDADARGTAALSSRPVWAPDSTLVALSYSAGDGSQGPDPRISLAQADGSGTRDLQIQAADPKPWWVTTNFDDFLWSPDGDRIVAVPYAERVEGGPYPLVTYTIDTGDALLNAGRLVGDVSVLFGWDVPGRSVWIMAPDRAGPEQIDVT